jgi:hypothetical protein
MKKLVVLIIFSMVYWGCEKTIDGGRSIYWILTMIGIWENFQRIL